MEKDLITILMPLYNGEKFLRKAIDSVLSQTYSNIELLIIDDGSEDETVNIVKEYKDKRIVFLEKEHSGLVNTLNFGLTKCNGEFIARMDQDDEMPSNKLEEQYNYMQNHPEIDILGTAINVIDSDGNKIGEIGPQQEIELNLSDFLNGNVVAHPTIFMRKESIDKLPFKYESYYVHAEDYKLWVTALIHGLRIVILPNLLLDYRQHPWQTTQVCREKQDDSAKKIKNIINFMLSNKKTSSEMTSIITFKNEGNEIEKTVASIRATTENMRILLLNDGSDDDYNYKEVAELYGCYYFKMKDSLGVAKARDYGVSQCPTEHFCIFDGHMRFYQYDWDKKIVEVLKKNPSSIVTTNSLYIWRNDKNELEFEDGGNFEPVATGNGALLRMGEPGWEFTPSFNGEEVRSEFKKKDVIPISTVFGAVYASTITHWGNICGLHGLISWGYDESMMSIKTWLVGGKCLLMRNLIVGHVYRDKAPYKTQVPDVDSNQIYLINLFADEKDIKKYERNLRKRIGLENFDKAYTLFSKRYFDCLGLRSYFFKNVAKYKIDYFLNLNYNISDYKNKKGYLIKKKDRINY